MSVKDTILEEVLHSTLTISGQQLESTIAIVGILSLAASTIAGCSFPNSLKVDGRIKRSGCRHSIC